MGELTPRVQMAIDSLIRRGIVGPRDIDERCMDQMRELTEAEALSSLEELWHVDRTTLKNARCVGYRGLAYCPFDSSFLIEDLASAMQRGLQCIFNCIVPKAYGTIRS